MQRCGLEMALSSSQFPIGSGDRHESSLSLAADEEAVREDSSQISAPHVGGRKGGVRGGSARDVCLEMRRSDNTISINHLAGD